NILHALSNGYRIMGTGISGGVCVRVRMDDAVDQVEPKDSGPWLEAEDGRTICGKRRRGDVLESIGTRRFRGCQIRRGRTAQNVPPQVLDADVDPREVRRGFAGSGEVVQENLPGLVGGLPLVAPPVHVNDG